MPLVVLAVFLASPTGAARAWFGLFCVLVAFPLVIRSASGPRATAGTGRAVRLGGTDFLSAVYPARTGGEIMTWLTRHITGQDPAALRPWSGIAFVAAALAVSHAVVVLYDQPIRRIFAARPLPATG